MIVIDAKDSVMGRIATKAAKLALQGETVAVVNAEMAVITGSPEFFRLKYKERLDKRVRGNPHYGPKLSRLPERLMRRAIRGMLPFKEAKGRKAFKRVMAYAGIPEKLKNEKPVALSEAAAGRGKKFVYLGELSKQLGAK